MILIGKKYSTRVAAVMSLTVFFLLFTRFATRSGHAEEGGCGHYMPGMMASFIDTLPNRPGLAVANYQAYYSGTVSSSRTIPVAGVTTASLSATEPGVYAGYMSSKTGTEFSLFAAFDFNTNNGDTDYQSGDSFHIDYTVAQHLPLFGGLAGAGVTGYYYKQFTADSAPGPSSARSRAGLLAWARSCLMCTRSTAGTSWAR